MGTMTKVALEDLYTHQVRNSSCQPLGDRVIHSHRRNRGDEAGMVKLIALMRTREDLSASEIRRMYEEEHVPLVMRLMPMISDYRRNYLHRSTVTEDERARADFDILTELWFDTEADLRSFVAGMRDREEGRQLRADSARFLVAGTTRLFEVDETVTVRAGEVPPRR